MSPAIFLDRDGVIVENRENYIRSWEDVEIFGQALVALREAAKTPYKIVIVTNQSAIGRGLVTPQAAEEINRRLLQEIEAAGGRVDGLFMCPHTPEDGCECRKPKPGLILQAARALSIDLSRSILIGDALSDLQAAQAAGVGQVALVRTGRGAEQAQQAEAAQIGPFRVFADLAEALESVLN